MRHNTPIYYIPDDPKEAAEQILQAYWDPDLIPVDSVHIALEMGITVHEPKEMPADTISVLHTKPDGKVNIYLLKGEDRPTKRFLCAFHLGQYLLHLRRGEEEFVHIYTRTGPLSGNDADKEDDEFTKKFAAWLLIPEDKLEELRHKYRNNYFAWRRAFDVEHDVLMFRLSLSKGPLRKVLNLGTA